MAFSPHDLNSDALEFLARARAIGTLATIKAGEPHQASVGYVYDAERHTIDIVTQPGSQKVLNVERACDGENKAAATFTDVEGMSWLQLAGRAIVCADEAVVAEVYDRFAQRYGPVHQGATLVVIRLEVERCMNPANDWAKVPKKG